MAGQPPWINAFQKSSLTVAQLLAEVGLRPEQLDGPVDFEPEFKVRAPPHFRSLIRRGDPHDPLLRQVIALAAERAIGPGVSKDPLEETRFRSGIGVTRKYKGRVLVLTTGACAIHCRYCFRRHYDYGALILTQQEIAQLRTMLSADDSVSEVILSGGDPLSLPDERLFDLLAAIARVEHVRIVRLHTRLPTTIPERVTGDLLEFIGGYGKRVVVVVHTNHANELDSLVKDALRTLHQSGVLLLNQAVLLRGVNDSVPALVDHSWGLFDCNVTPYYVHMLDPVEGAAHFAVEENVAMALQEGIRVELPGYLVPRFVREIPGEPYKTPIELLVRPMGNHAARSDHIEGNPA